MVLLSGGIYCVGDCVSHVWLAIMLALLAVLVHMITFSMLNICAQYKSVHDPDQTDLAAMDVTLVISELSILIRGFVNTYKIVKFADRGVLGMNTKLYLNLHSFSGISKVYFTIIFVQQAFSKIIGIKIVLFLILHLHIFF